MSNVSTNIVEGRDSPPRREKENSFLQEKVQKASKEAFGIDKRGAYKVFLKKGCEVDKRRQALCT